MPTSHWHQHYCWPSMYICRKFRMHSQNFHSQLIRPPFPRGSRLNKIHPRGNPAIARSIPAVFPQHSYPHPRETRGFRGIPAVPIPVHTSIYDHEGAGRVAHKVFLKSSKWWHFGGFSLLTFRFSFLSRPFSVGWENKLPLNSFLSQQHLCQNYHNRLLRVTIATCQVNVVF